LMRSLLSQSQTPTAPRRAVGFFRSGRATSRYGRRTALQRLQRPGWRAPIARLTPTPLEVTVRLRVLAWPRSSGSFGSPLPPRAFSPSPGPAPCGLSSSPLTRSTWDLSSDPLARFSLLQGVPDPLCPRPFHGGASPGLFIPFSAFGLAGYSPEVPPSGTPHVYGFPLASRTSFRPILSGLVSSRKHSWGSPFRGFPSDVAPPVRHRKLPSCRSHGGHRSLARVPRTAHREGWVDFRVFTSSESVRGDGTV